MILKNRCYIYFLLCWILYPIFMVSIEHNWLFSGEMWAEGGSNYFPSSIAKDIGTILFSTDAGYWAFCQRILAVIPILLGFPIRMVPYFYSWSAILLTPLLVAPICLPVFRKLIESDFLRFLLSLFLLMMIDFETAIFINFTYFAIFLVIIITGLAYVTGKKSQIPAWSWIIPFLIFTKPSIMATVPLMFLVAFFANKRFIYITIVSIIACLAQFIRLYTSYAGGVFQHMHQINFTFLQKLSSSFILFFKFLQVTFTGKWGTVLFVVPGIVFFIFLAFMVYKFYKSGRKNNAILIALGTMLIYLNMFLLCFSLPKMWNFTVSVSATVNRYTFVNILGIFLIAVSFADALNKKKKNFGILAFILWFVISGFGEIAINDTKEKEEMLYHSKWQKNYAEGINSQAACIPVNPFNWFYSKPECKILDFHLKDFNGNYMFYDGRPYYFDDAYQNNLASTHLESFLIYALPPEGSIKEVKTRAYIEFEDGETIVLSTSDTIGPHGGVIQVLLPDNDKRIKSIRFNFDSPVFIGVDKNQFPIITWLGKTKEV